MLQPMHKGVFIVDIQVQHANSMLNCQLFLWLTVFLVHLLALIRDILVSCFTIYFTW